MQNPQMKIFKGKLKPNIVRFINISLIVLRHDELVQIQSTVEGLKSIIFTHKKSKEPN
jgi:hypothetical protein